MPAKAIALRRRKLPMSSSCARATNADNFDPVELPHGHRSDELPPFALAVAPILIVLAVNLIMSLFVLPRAKRK
jgi:hypothetical protein